MTADALNDCNKRHLAQLAKEKGITGWHAMRKDQLIRALSSSRSAPSGNRKKKTVLHAAVASRRKKTASRGGGWSRQIVCRAGDTHPDTWTTLARKTGSSS